MTRLIRNPERFATGPDVAAMLRKLASDLEGEERAAVSVSISLVTEEEYQAAMARRRKP